MEKRKKISELFFLSVDVLKKQRIMLAIAAALFGIVALSPSNFYFVGFVFLVPFFYFLHKEKSFWKLVLGTFVFRLFFAIGSAYYTMEPLVWTASMCIFLGLPVVIFLLKISLGKLHNASMIYVPLAYLVFDLLQARYSYLPTYIITAGNIFGKSPFVGLAKYGGLFSLEFFVVVVNAFLLWVMINRRTFLARKKNAVLFVLSFIVLMLGAYFLSERNLGKNLEKILSYQNELKITTVSVENNFSIETLDDVMRRLSAVESDLIVLPEEMFTKTGNDPFRREEISDIIKKYGFKSSYVAGTFHVKADGNRYNEFLIMDNKGDIFSRYDKNRLAIMGEYWPYAWHPSFYDFLKNDPVMKNYAIFNKNNSYKSGDFNLLGIRRKNQEIKFGALICLEGHYEDMIARYGESGAKFIVNPTSNRWISLGSRQYDHLVGNLYAIESVQSGLPIVVSAINGFAGVIFPDSDLQIGTWDDKLGYAILTARVGY